MQSIKNRTKAVVLRFTADEYAELKSKSGNAVFARWCRDLLLGHKVEYVRPNTKFNAVDPLLLREINRIGVSINQIARVLNTSSVVNKSLTETDVIHLLLTLDSVNQCLKQVKDDYQTTKK